MSRGRLELVAAAALFSTGGAVVKLVSFGGLQLAGLRSLVAAALLLVVLPRARRRWSASVWLAGTAYAATLVLFVTANKLTTAANTIFLQDTAPLYVLLLGPWLLREPLRARDIAFLVVLAAGLALFFASPDPVSAIAADPARGNLLAALSGLTWALTIVALRFHSRGDGGDGAAAVVCGNLLAAVFCLPWMLPLPAASATDWAGLAFLGLVQIGLAYLLVLAGMRHVAALEASLLLLVEPVLSPIWAWLVHGERPTAWALAGGAIILAATATKTVLEGRQRRRSPAAPGSDGPAARPDRA
ncbi:MAG: DMT family transporter [Thermoanaerobaculia bacterium]